MGKIILISNGNLQNEVEKKYYNEESDRKRKRPKN